MNKKVRTTLLVEVESECIGDCEDFDEETVAYLVKNDLEQYAFKVYKSEVLKPDYGLILEQLKRVNEAELKHQMEVTQLNELMKKLER